MFPIFMQKLDYINFINHYKISVAQHTFFFIVRQTPQISQILNVFQKLGLVRRFVRVNNRFYRVYPTWAFNRNYLHNIKVHSHPKNHLRIKLNALWVLKQSIGSSTILLNTTKGILTHREALKYRLGGHLLCVIF